MGSQEVGYTSSEAGSTDDEGEGQSEDDSLVEDLAEAPIPASIKFIESPRQKRNGASSEMALIDGNNLFCSDSLYF